MKSIVHWCKQKKRWTHHTYKSCAKAEYLLIRGGWEVETKPHRPSNPRGWVKTTHDKVFFITEQESNALLHAHPLCPQLFYNKQSVEFNIQSGEQLLFTPQGAFILPDQICQ